MSKIMIIEDHPATREMMVLALESAGHTVQALSDGVGLIKKTKEFGPDVVLMDLMLPWVSGFDLIQAIRDEEDIKDCTILVVSAKVSPDDVNRAKECGANEFVEKPVDMPRLLSLL